MIHSDLATQPTRHLVVLHGALLRQASALIAQAAHVEAVVARRCAALPPAEATDCRVALAHAHNDLLDVIVAEDGARLPQPITTTTPKP